MKLIQSVIPAFASLCVTGAALSDTGYGNADHHSLEMPRGHWMAPAHAANQPNPIRADSASLTRGKEIYEANCVSCHGITGHGDGPDGPTLKSNPANLAVMAPKHSAGDLAWKIAEGRDDMPAWKNTLSKSQIWDVVNYLRKGLLEPKKNLPARTSHHPDGKINLCLDWPIGQEVKSCRRT